MVEIELCVEDSGSLAIGNAAGVDRIELCSALALGGLTPSLGLMRQARALDVPVLALVRPRAGGFSYNAAEEAQMVADIEAAAEVGLSGIVIGALDDDGHLDIPLLSRLSSRHDHLDRTLHRAFDCVADMDRALDAAIDLGFSRILTSGGAVNAPAGALILKRLVDRARGRLTIMAGGGVTPSTAGDLTRKSGVGALHGSFRREAAPDMPIDGGRLEALGFGAPPRLADADAITAVQRLLQHSRPTM